MAKNTRLYDILEVDPSATMEKIRQQYKALSMKRHPDRSGTQEEFVALQQAFDILSDETKRREYDETGNIPGEAPDTTNEDLSRLMMSLIDSIDVDRVDLIGAMKKKMADAIESSQDVITELHKRIGKRNLAIKRLKRKGGGENILVAVLEQDIKRCDGAIQILHDDIAKARKLHDAIDGYEYSVESWMPEASNLGGGRLYLHEGQGRYWSGLGLKP